jgi:hypothetical protein
MSALPGIIGLVIFLYLRPQEFVPGLSEWPLIHVSLAVAVLGLAHDVVERRTRLTPAPQLPWVAPFSVWCLLGLAYFRRDALLSQGTRVLTGLMIYLIMAHAVQRVRAFVMVVTTIFAIGLFVAYVGVDQGMSSFQCLVKNRLDTSAPVYPDGQECVPGQDDEDDDDDDALHGDLGRCVETGEPGVVYVCEHMGMLGTYSVGGGRVRYLGVLQDPNDLALATTLAVPFAFAFFEMRRSALRLALLVFTVGVVGAEVVYTKSRGGQVTFGAVLGAYFIKKYGWKHGVFVGAAMILPIAVLGGRSGDADSSTLERLGCACAGIKMFSSYPLTGVGYGQFTEHHPLTAHNAYILAAGELGVVGMGLFAFILYLSIKIPIVVLRYDMGADVDARTTKALAMAMLAALSGAAVGIFFLSWTYHYVLWIHIGLSGALYSLVRARYHDFECRLTFAEAWRIVLGYAVFLVVWTWYIRVRGAWE